MSRRGPLLALAGLLAAAALAWPPLRGVAAGQRIPRIFEQANEANARGEYDAAIEGYRRLLDAGIEDPDVLFNLATAYARAGQYGRAILHFERTLRRDPGDEGAQKGLAAAREALGRERAQRAGEATVDAGPPFPEVLVRGVSTDALAWALLVLDILLFGFLLARHFARRDSVRLALGVAAPVAMLALVTAGAGLAIKHGMFREGEPGIVLEREAVLREGPHPQAAPRGEVLEGDRVRVLGRHGRFVHVRLRNDREGWVTASEVEAI